MNKPVKQLITISTLLLTGMHIINRYTDTCITPVTTAKNDKTFVWKDLKINYAEKGNKNNPTLLLLHNLSPSSSKEEWYCIDDKLSEQFHIFELDLPGCGRSDKPNVTYINYMYVQLLHDFITKIIEKKVNICTTAYSSAFTFMTARMYTEIIDKIIVINPTSFEQLYAPITKEGKLKEKILDLPILGTFLYNCIMSKSSIENNYKYLYYYNEKNVPEKAVDISYYNAHCKQSSGKYLLRSMLGNYTNINIIHALPKINNQIYLIGNRNYKKIFQKYKKYNPSICTIYVSNCRMLPQMEIPKTIIENICDILLSCHDVREDIR